MEDVYIKLHIKIEAQRSIYNGISHRLFSSYLEPNSHEHCIIFVAYMFSKTYLDLLTKTKAILVSTVVDPTICGPNNQDRCFFLSNPRFFKAKSKENKVVPPWRTWPWMKRTEVISLRKKVFKRCLDFFFLAFGLSWIGWMDGCFHVWNMFTLHI